MTRWITCAGGLTLGVICGGIFGLIIGGILGVVGGDVNAEIDFCAEDGASRYIHNEAARKAACQ